MEASPRSSKRRKLDTPSHAASTPLLNSTLRKRSGRIASRADASGVDGTVEAPEQSATLPRQSSRKPATTRNGAVNGTPRKRGAAEDGADVYDDIDGALPSTDQSPSASPAPSTISRTRRRKKYVFDPSMPNPFKSDVGSTTPKAHGTKEVNRAGRISRASSRVLANGHKAANNTESDIQGELAAEAEAPLQEVYHPKVATPSGRKFAALNDTPLSKNGRATRRTGNNTDEKVSADLTRSNGLIKSSPKAIRTSSAHEKNRIGIKKLKSLVSPTKMLKRRTHVSDSEDELGNHDPPSRSKAARERRRTHRADHFDNEDVFIVSAENQDEDTAAPDVDEGSTVGSVLDPTEPSPFNKPGSTQKASDPASIVQESLPAGRELDLLKSIVLERIAGKRSGQLVELDEQYQAVYQLVEHTVTAGEGNSILLIGARGSGKTALVNKVLSEVSRDNSGAYYVVRLNGFIHTDDKIALREIWRQLGKEMDVEEDEALAKNYADALTTLLALLSHPSEHTGEVTEQVAKAVIFVMDEFDLFAQHPRQTLLYNLFDIAQSRKAPIAVLGLTTRIDVANSLEKRVKSRFSHRYVYLSLAKTFTSFQEMCKATLVIQPDQLPVEERLLLTSDTSTTPSKTKKTNKVVPQDFLSIWNSNILTLFASSSFLTNYLASTFYLSKSIPTVLTSLLMPIYLLSPTHSAIFPSLALQPPESKLSLITSLSTVALSLLISAARLDIIHDSDTCNFNMAYDEYVTLASKARIQSAAGGASASGGMIKVWGKEVAKREWEELIELGLLMPVISGQTGGFAMVKCDVALEEIGEILKGDKTVEKALERWCRHL